jgi:hypothetical protein
MSAECSVCGFDLCWQDGDVYAPSYCPVCHAEELELENVRLRREYTDPDPKRMTDAELAEVWRERATQAEAAFEFMLDRRHGSPPCLSHLPHSCGLAGWMRADECYTFDKGRFICRDPFTERDCWREAAGLERSGGTVWLCNGFVPEPES